MKNPNGFGTVYKMSGKRRKKWRAVKTVGWEDNGKQKRVTIGYFESKQEAMEALGKYIYNPNSNLTIKDVYEMWSEKHFLKVTKSSKVGIISRFNVYISKIGDRNINEIKLQEIQFFIDSLKVSSSILFHIKTILNMIFDFALKNEFISKNPIKFLEVGKYEKVYEKKEFTQDEIDILWNNLDVPYVDTILMLIYSGARVMELLTLKLENIDLEKRTIFIAESKTSSGIRYIPIHPKILSLIKKRMHNQEYLILNKKNETFLYKQYLNLFKKTLKKIGIEEHFPHECRHTTATLLSNAGANPISIAKIMGHSNYAMTANVYTHKNKEELEKAMTLM